MSSTRDRGTLIEKIGCHMCGSSDAMAVYKKPDGTIDGYCWSCAKPTDDPYKQGNKPVSKQAPYYHKMSVNDVHELPILELPDRKIRKETMEYFGVRVAYDEATATRIAEHYYPIVKEGGITGYKKRDVEKKEFTSVGDCKGGELFGQHQANIVGGRKLFITEGEIDAMTVFQVLRDKNVGTQWESLIPAVVSLTKGASSADKELSRQLEFMDKFEQIILVFDNDEAGKEGLEKAAQVVPLQKLYVCKLPKKDPNEMLKAGLIAELERALLFQSKIYRPVTVVGVDDVIAEAMVEPQMGMEWLWPTLNFHTYGRHPGNMYGIGAGVGIGKSTFWFAQVGYDMKKGLGKHGLFMFEETPPDALKLLASQVYAKDFNNPDVVITPEERREAYLKLKDHVYFCDHRNMLLGSKDSWNEIINAIKHMAIVEDCVHITLDPITALTAQMSTSEANEFLNGAMSQLAGLAKQLDICIYYGSHLNKPLRGKPHEEGGRVQVDQFTGSKAMIRWSQYILGIERDNQDPDEYQANTTWCRLLKIRRRFRKEQCLFPIHYNHEDGSFLEISKAQGGDVPPCDRSTRENPGSGLKSDWDKETSNF